MTVKKVRYEGCFLNSPMQTVNHTTDNLEDHHLLLELYLGEHKLPRAEVFIRVTSDEKLEVVVNKIDHWEYEGTAGNGDYDHYSELIGKIDVKIPPLTIKRQLGDNAVDWKTDNVNERSK